MVDKNIQKLNLGSSKHRKKENFYGILFASPAILGYSLFVFLPMIISLIYSFTDYAVVNQTKFVGLDNYINMFSGEDPFFYKSLGVTSYYVLLSVPLQIIFAFFLAILLNQNIKGRSIFRTIFYLPTIVPVVASSMIWLWLYDPDLGVLNSVLRTLGLPTSQWIWAESSVIPSLAIMSLWSIGGQVVIFLAGLQDVPAHLYESAEIDGSTSVQKLLHITIPLMTPTIFFNLIMNFINSFQIFSQAYIMTDGGPNNASLFYVFYLYREAFKFSKLGSAFAIGWVLFMIILVLTLLVLRSSSKWVYYEGEVK
ncbi:sugar ABC transporter permease [Paenibacillus psychroresistens]|uniref:Sugar ABC transporter permease n=1 Tax=Paenibacillus psychroresistens TaxID=1778678 RepID=A0A6B8RJE8_9BACL|nr:sugar ABC transporter permease [Paenibacillus psychroresistens]QGQ95448.1 sugar ABC transporter permease [Paenibacillus psychroresistens]